MLPRLPRRHLGTLLVLVGAWVMAAAPVGVGNDGLVRFQSLDTLLRHGRLDSAKYSLYGPVAAAPLWYLGEALGNSSEDTEETVWVFNRVAFLAAVAGLWLALRSVLPREERLRFAALLFFGSMFPWHMMGFFGEVFHAACVGLGLALLAVRRGGWAFFGAALCVWGTANVPASVVGLALAAGVLAWHRRRLRYLLLPALAAVMIALENQVRHGNPLEGGYAGEAGNRTALPYSGLPGFSYPLFFGLLSILLSFGKGLVFFTPGLFVRYPEEPELPRDAEARFVYRLWLAVVVGLVLVYARWWAWYGGAVWGPRFFLFACLPASLVLARRTANPQRHSTGANLLALAAVALSCWVGASGLVFQGHGAARYWRDDFALEYLTWYAPECSVLWLPFVAESKPLTWKEYSRLAAFALAFAYLAWPVVRVLASRARAAWAVAWLSLRAGPRWRV
jgi:hypothetical protein